MPGRLVNVQKLEDVRVVDKLHDGDFSFELSSSVWLEGHKLLVYDLDGHFETRVLVKSHFDFSLPQIKNFLKVM